MITASRQRFGSGCIVIPFDTDALLGDYGREVLSKVARDQSRSPQLFTQVDNGCVGYDLDNRQHLRMPCHDPEHVYYPQR
jgi:hypothetical protein